MDRLPLVSIIMPTYNRADYILETIKSIKDQTYSNWELFVLDDGSEDNTEDVVSSVKDDRVKYTKFARSGKTGKLKNIGINNAKGELITFMDSDDLWLKEKLELQVEALLKNPEAGFSYTNGYNFDETREYPPFLKRTAGIVCEQMFYPYCLGERGVYIQTVMVWKRNIERAGYFGEKYIFHDYGFAANLAYHYTVAILYQPLLLHRIHKTNSIRFFAKEKEQEDEFLEVIRSSRDKGWLPGSIANEALFRYYINTGIAHATELGRFNAYGYLLRAWSVKPFSVVPIKKIIKVTLGL